MPRIKLTQSAVARAEHDGNDRNNSFYWDTALGNFALAVSPSGRKTYVIQYRSHRVSRRMTVGRADHLNVDEARKLARKLLSQVDQGTDPLLEKRRVEGASRSTLRAVGEEYIAANSKMRSIGLRRSVLDRLIYPELGAYQIEEVRRVDIARVLRKIGAENGLAAADQALAILRAIVNWHALNDEDYRPPSFRKMTQTADEDRMRSRVLTDDEIRAIWTADIAQPWGAFVRFLLLTALRRNEAARARWGEIHNGALVIPAARYKTKAETRFPLSRAATALLDGLPRVHGSDWIFTTDGKRPISSFTGGKEIIDRASGTRGWTFHDCRRTARTLLSRAKVDPDVAERALGHKIRGIRKTYDWHDYASEMLQAFETLPALIERIVKGG
jgi:integrase